MASRNSKSPNAFKTISEVAELIDVPQHVLRFWESKFSHIKPMKRGGGRRYYRPQDVELIQVIKLLLHDDGYTIKGVQKLLREKGLKSFLNEYANELEIDQTDSIEDDQELEKQADVASLSGDQQSDDQAMPQLGLSLESNVDDTPKVSGIEVERVRKSLKELADLKTQLLLLKKNINDGLSS